MTSILPRDQVSGLTGRLIAAMQDGKLEAGVGA